ncbi:MAG: GCN5-related N-acetyltransferase, partial [Acidimicrobiales bacterium]|nr:GCN5-related N-acetyltransferase [Acidimicrobiales bacterium]
RRFGLALPPPFAPAPPSGDPLPPVRLAAATDGAAIAAVKWRAFGTSYRGILPDEFLDRREVVPPVAFWVGRAMVPPSRRHALLAWGRPGEVLGYLDAGPCRDADVDPDVTAEVYELYVDPSTQGIGGGRLLLERAVSRLRADGAEELRLWVLAANTRAHAFYSALGWEPDGAERHEDLGVVAVDEVRYRLAA